ncbi:hypothetical protein [Mesorhizobium sophorae]|uniref:hypothetical protein n=1 Tax=Mesorhizobium sophorae TaxID=1300294 RepID=UPI001FD95B32|nr:hypothetical protein [Mesorhizobium sophorae]
MACAITGRRFGSGLDALIARRSASFQDVSFVACSNEVAGQANGPFARLLQSSREPGDFLFCRVAILAGSIEIALESICSPTFQCQRFAGPLCSGLSDLAVLNSCHLCSRSQFSARLKSIERLVRRGKVAFEAFNRLSPPVKRASRSRQGSFRSLVRAECGGLFADREIGFDLQAFDFALRHSQILREPFGSLLLVFKGLSLKSRRLCDRTRTRACVGCDAPHLIKFVSRRFQFAAKNPLDPVCRLTICRRLLASRLKLLANCR